MSGFSSRSSQYTQQHFGLGGASIFLAFDFVVAFTHGSWVLRLIREMKFPQQGLNKILKYSRHN
jgi:hypothetical protein